MAQNRRFRISRSRRLCMDVLHFHRKVPICPHDRMCDLRPLIEARTLLPVRISWAVIFIKAFAKMAERLPEFRQCYLGFPWLHGYEHQHSVGMIALERQFEGERWLFWGRFRNPEQESLFTLQQQLERYQQQPVEKIFKQQVQFSYLPTVLRRFIWWWNLNISGAARAKRAGTFFLTTLAGKQAEIQNPPAFHTANFTYGPFDEEGKTRVTISYDHRLMDGSLVADALAELERALNEDIREELLRIADEGIPMRTPRAA